MRGLSLLLMAAMAVASGCGGDDADADRALAGTDSGEALPAPERTGGSVTGMPDAGDPNRTLPPPEAPTTLPPGTAVDSDGNLLPPFDALAGADPAPPDGVEPGAAGPDPAMSPAPVPDDAPASTPAGPGAAEAVAVVKAYYDSISAGSYGSAYTLWSGNGSASGQSPQQFANSFAGVSGMSVEILTPGRIDAAAGSRYIEVPVAVRTTRADGSVHRYAGAYTLRRAVVDGASAEQQAWRIASADIREVQP